jgi:uncharacterized membrane protein (DUF2068 family)
MSQGKRSSAVIVLIGLFKLLKAALLIGLAIGAFHLVHRDAQRTIMEWVQKIQVDPDNRFIHGLLARATKLDERRLREIGVGTILYGLLFTIEGVGLLMRKRWAEYLTVVTTALLLPLEVYEITRKLSAMKILVFVGNVFIAIYLIVQLRKRPREEGAATTTSPRVSS